MKPINTYYLFHLGRELAVLDEIDLGNGGLGMLGVLSGIQQEKPKPGNPYIATTRIFNASKALLTFQQSSFDLSISKPLGAKLLISMLKVLENLQEQRKPDEGITKAESKEIREIQKEAKKFASFLEEELAKSDIYFVGNKAAYQTSALIDSGEKLFPDELSKKAPPAIFDVQQGARCLAFELWTASAFHFQRANESVVHVYWDHVSGGDPRPKRNSVGVYLDEMDNRNIGTPEVKAALRDLNSLHRNPLIHPEHNIESMHEAIALMNAIHNAIYSMLKEIP